MSLKIRPMKDEDTNFILSTWLKSYREYGPSPVPESSIYYKEHQKHIKSLLSSESIVACTEDEEQIVGFLVATNQTAHYVYVKAVFRKFGVANRLIDSVKRLKYFSQFTKFAPLFEKRGLQYNPYKFYQGVIGENQDNESISRGTPVQ